MFLEFLWVRLVFFFVLCYELGGVWALSLDREIDALYEGLNCGKVSCASQGNESICIHVLNFDFHGLDLKRYVLGYCIFYLVGMA
jgi:hypothetical protein